MMMNKNGVSSNLWIQFLTVLLLCAFMMPCIESGQLVLPSQLAVNYGSVTHAGQVCDIADILQNVQELDLSKNKIAQWHEVQTQSICLTVSVSGVVTEGGGAIPPH